MACENPEDCNDPTYTTPVPVAPFPVAGGGSGGGSGGGGGSCDCDPTSGSYPTSTTLSTDINGTTQVSLASCSGLSSSDVVLKETLIYDSDGTVGRVIALNSGKLTVQTMTTAGDGAGSKSDGSYLTTSTLTTAFTGTTNVPQNTVTGLSPADVVINETLIFDGEGTVGRVIGISGSNYIVQTMTISPGERSGTRLGSVERETNLPANCAAAVSLGWQTPISGDFAYVRDHDGHLAEFVATVDGSCNITWAWSHDLNAGDYLTGVKDQDGNPLPIDGDGMVTLPRESDGTYHSDVALNKSIGGTRNIALASTDIAAIGDIVLNETLVYDDDGTVGKITNVSGTTLTVKTVTISGAGDDSDGSYPTTATLDKTIANSTTIGYATISGIVPIADIVLNETLIYDGDGTLGRVVSVNAGSNTVTVETMTTAGSQDRVSDGTYATTDTLDRTIGATQSVNLSNTAIANASDIIPGETLLFDSKGTMGRVDSVSGTGVLTVTTITNGVGATTNGLVGGWFYADSASGGVATVDTTAGNYIRFWLLALGTDPNMSAAFDHQKGSLRTELVNIPDPIDGRTYSFPIRMVELTGPAVYQAELMISAAGNGTDTTGQIFIYDPDTNTSNVMGSAAKSVNNTTSPADSNKVTSGYGQAFVEVPAGKTIYVGAGISRAAGFVNMYCSSFSVHQISGTKFLGDTTSSNKICIVNAIGGSNAPGGATEAATVDGTTSVRLIGTTLSGHSWGGNEAEYGDTTMVTTHGAKINQTGFYAVGGQIYAGGNWAANDGLVVKDPGSSTWRYLDWTPNSKAVTGGSRSFNAQVTYLKAGSEVSIATGVFQGTQSGYGGAELTVALISGDSPAELMMKPNLWTPNTEINFGDGVYGYRMTGTSLYNDIQMHSESIGSTSYAQTKSTGITGVKTMVNYGGSYRCGVLNNYRQGIPVGWTVGLGGASPASSSQAVLPFIARDGDTLAWQSGFGNADGIANTAPSPYDLWVIYTK